MLVALHQKTGQIVLIHRFFRFFDPDQSRLFEIDRNGGLYPAIGVEFTQIGRRLGQFVRRQNRSSQVDQPLQGIAFDIFERQKPRLHPAKIGHPEAIDILPNLRTYPPNIRPREGPGGILDIALPTSAIQEIAPLLCTVFSHRQRECIGIDV